MEAERAEEREVLQSIYDGDANFSQIKDNLFQYKYNECGNFVLEVRWGENYPEEAPIINMDVFYNKHIVAEVKEGIVKAVAEQAEAMLGMSMTFTLIEWLKDNNQPFMEQQEQLSNEAKINTAAAAEIATQASNININGNPENTKFGKKKSDGLTKNQKRRMWDRQNAAGEKDRGYDWVDVIKHLSQTGGAVAAT